MAQNRYLEKLIQIYLRAETDIINEIGRLRSQGLIDYHAVASLERVQGILRQLETDCWEHVPKMIEREFYVAHPEVYTRVPGVTPIQHLSGYQAALNLTGEQHAVVDQLVMQLMGEITDGALTAMETVQTAILGRTEPDIYRRVGLEVVAAQQATGRGLSQTVPGFVERLRREGITAYVDRAGRRWSLHTYCSMATRTTARQAEVQAVLTADPDQDLYKITSHGTTCALCAPYEGRVYSKSGTSPDYPPLADAFGRRPDAVGTGLSATWLNIHPNCLHSIAPWTPAGRSQKELEEIRRFSNPRTNPYSRDPRTQQQIDAYRNKEAARAQWLRDYRQWERYRMTLGDKVPKTFETFQRHKNADDKKYQTWLAEYREANDE